MTTKKEYLQETRTLLYNLIDHRIKENFIIPYVDYVFKGKINPKEKNFRDNIYSRYCLSRQSDFKTNLHIKQMMSEYLLQLVNEEITKRIKLQKKHATTKPRRTRKAKISNLDNTTNG